MPYKGNDLDLRPARPAVPREAVAAARAEPAREAAPVPIAVDELVLACSNTAYDVARFHGAREVRLEHLLHALTREAAAADQLGELGIRADHLRRETAAAIAAEMPSGLLEGGGAGPRASAAFEDVLRRAADHAARRRSPATVHDLVRALLGGGPGSPAAALLVRSAADPLRLERWREEPQREAFVPAPPPAVAEPPPREAVPPLPPHLAEQLLARLAQMEAGFQALRAEVAADRRAIGDLVRDVQGELQAFRAEARKVPPPTEHAVDLANLVREVQGELHALRAEVRRLPPAGEHAADLAGFMRSMQAELQSVRAELERAPAAVHAADPLLESRMTDLGGAVAAVAERLAAIDRLAGGEPWQDLRARLEAAEARLAERTTGITGTLAGNLDRVERELQAQQEAMEGHWSSAGERHVALESVVRAQLQLADDAAKAQGRSQGEIYRALEQLGENQHTLGESLNTWRIETGGDIAIVSNGLQKLEQSVLDLFGQLAAEVHTLRQESYENGSRGGFKRWLYGTRDVLGASYRDDPHAIRTDGKR